MKRANYHIVNEDEDCILLEDDGPWDRFLSITNAAEIVVEELAQRGKLNGRCLVYYDTDGSLTELFYNKGVFTGFGVAPDKIIERLMIRGEMGKKL